MSRLVVLTLVAALTACEASGNQLTNRAGTVVKDAYLVAAVRAKLVGIDADSTTDVRVDVNHGIVTLGGRARSSRERAQYVAAAQSISGVRSVRDDMSVDPHLRGISERARDAALAVRVSAAIASQAGGNVFHVSPQVRDGIVTLHGTVPSLSVERTIVHTTEHLSGVRGVVNELVIRP